MVSYDTTELFLARALLPPDHFSFSYHHALRLFGRMRCTRTGFTVVRSVHCDRALDTFYGGALHPVALSHLTFAPLITSSRDAHTVLRPRLCCVHTHATPVTFLGGCSSARSISGTLSPLSALDVVISSRSFSFHLLTHSVDRVPYYRPVLQRIPLFGYSA